MTVPLSPNLPGLTKDAESSFDRESQANIYKTAPSRDADDRVQANDEAAAEFARKAAKMRAHLLESAGRETSISLLERLIQAIRRLTRR